MREQLINLVEIIPVEFIIRNIATGSLTKRLGITDGTILKKPLVEYSYKNDELGDPLVAKEHILAFEWATNDELEKIKNISLRINDFMLGMFRGVGIKLVDFKLEFGRLEINGKNEIILADEISPDTCRLCHSQGHTWTGVYYKCCFLFKCFVIMNSVYLLLTFVKISYEIPL